MFNPRHFLRMARWAHRPPSEKRVKLVLLVIVLCFVVFGIERIFGFPQWLAPDNTPRGRL